MSHMIDINITGFIKAWSSSKPQGDTVLEQIRREAEEEGLPIIPPETAAFISCVLALTKPKRALEVGCCVGYSAGLVASRSNAEITTIDRYDYMIAKARENFRRMGYEDRITLIEGDAGEVLPLLAGSFDFIFVDAAKGQYPEFFRECNRLLSPGGILIFDDIFQDGRILQNRLDVPRRQRTIHTRLNNFLSELAAAANYTSCLLPIGDGLAFCMKNAEVRA